ncbi:MAG: HEAT repeat domain-containing protein [Planctomycetota bacterium]
MSIAVLNEVYAETRRLAIAGSNLASDDFRLKKLIDPLQKAGEKAPVFARVAQAVKDVVSSDAESSPQRLLELGTLVTAIRYTQGRTGAAKEARSIEGSDFGLTSSNTSARVLKPLIEALKSTGSGRLEIISEAHERGVFNDIRLVKLAVAAIDDGYSEIGEYVATQILPAYGTAILPELAQTLDVKGKGGHARRLVLMHKLDSVGSRKKVEEALESGSKELKVAAISCLKDSEEHLSFLLSQVKARSQEVRRAALDAIAGFSQPEVVEALLGALGGTDAVFALYAVSRNRSPELLDRLLELTNEQLEAVLATKDKAKRLEALTRLFDLLLGFQSRSDKKSISFLLGCFEQRENLARVKNRGGTDGSCVVERVAGLLAESKSKSAQEQLIEAHESLPPDALEWALVAGLQTCTIKRFFTLFSPYYVATIPKKRGANPAKDKQEVVAGFLSGETGHSSQTSKAKLDSRWLEAAVKLNDLPVVMALAQPKHRGAIKLLSKTVDAKLKGKGATDYDVSDLLRVMIRIEHPKCVEHFVNLLVVQDGSRPGYYTHWLMELIPYLPKDAVSKIEAVVPKLSEQTIDLLIPVLEQLKKR